MNLFCLKNIAVVLTFTVSITAAKGECINNSIPSCDVYTSCFAKYCPCKDNSSEYFISYGKKYCKLFLSNSNLSKAGKKWRDRTLVCLQEKIVPELDISENPSCDCAKMRKTAFDSHVGCYTQSDASICSLGIADINEIGQTIDLTDAFSSEGWAQMRGVAKICTETALDDGRRTAWKNILTVLDAF